jgi:hypothetical protein
MSFFLMVSADSGHSAPAVRRNQTIYGREDKNLQAVIPVHAGIQSITDFF